MMEHMSTLSRLEIGGRAHDVSASRQNTRVTDSLSKTSQYSTEKVDVDGVKVSKTADTRKRASRLQ